MRMWWKWDLRGFGRYSNEICREVALIEMESGCRHLVVGSDGDGDMLDMVMGSVKIWQIRKSILWGCWEMDDMKMWPLQLWWIPKYDLHGMQKDHGSSSA